MSGTGPSEKNVGSLCLGPDTVSGTPPSPAVVVRCDPVLAPSPCAPDSNCGLAKIHWRLGRILHKSVNIPRWICHYAFVGEDCRVFQESQGDTASVGHETFCLLAHPHSFPTHDVTMRITVRKGKLIFAPLLIAVLLSTSGCATLFSGSSDEVTFESEPPGAMVRINGIDKGETPVTVSVDRDAVWFSDRNQVTMLKDGYEERSFAMQTEWVPISILNMFTGVGWVVDVYTGNMWKSQPTSYDMELEKKE